VRGREALAAEGLDEIGGKRRAESVDPAREVGESFGR
jgi:hypothetical protein